MNENVENARVCGSYCPPVVVERATSFAKVSTLEKIGNGKRFVHKIPSSTSDVATKQKTVDIPVQLCISEPIE